MTDVRDFSGVSVTFDKRLLAAIDFQARKSGRGLVVKV